ncbi:uncharacterized protein RCC_02322 [Ramularia collo-cygni]|uniref:Uncharacterized protein n=1 Tax=Ramularia collo-cygni TaxID=112498 RepID=A0A2D3V4R3_9PEZI|nr:uncharacterized protein RCC_02322 [Ramularia collo-cygni]CZT16479.1 uncharacterized protein RCC_02322 [Ramularia collo-cygni]
MTKPEPVSEADIWLAKMNVGLSRSERVLQSWMRPAQSLDNGTSSSQIAKGDDNSDEDFTAMAGSGGIGTVASADDAVPGRKKLSDGNQKLLEHLLGKRAAAAKMKEKKPHTSANGQSGSKPMPVESKSRTTMPADDSEDDEEMGRASTLSSRGMGGRKVRDTKRPAYTTAGGEEDNIVDPDVEPSDPREDLATVAELVTQEKHDAQAVKRPAKRKATSYMDEMLAKKKSRGKKKSGGKGNDA